MNPKVFRLNYEDCVGGVKEDNIRNNMSLKAIEASQKRAAKKYSYPKTAEEWWQVVYDYWDDLILVVSKYVRLQEMRGLDKNELSVKTLLENSIIAKQNKDAKLANLFNNAWVSAPDNGSIHGDMAWGILCDLCSECYLLYPDGFPDEE